MKGRGETGREGGSETKEKGWKGSTGRKEEKK